MELDHCLRQKKSFQLQIADLNQSTNGLKRKISTIQSESEEKLKMKSDFDRKVAEKEEKLKKMKSDLDQKVAENTRLKYCRLQNPRKRLRRRA
jgi:hypothetical protein